MNRVIEIKNCNECPHQRRLQLSAQPFCGKHENKTLPGELLNSPQFHHLGTIPEWCPLPPMGIPLKQGDAYKLQDLIQVSIEAMSLLCQDPAEEGQGFHEDLNDLQALQEIVKESVFQIYPKVPELSPSDLAFIKAYEGPEEFLTSVLQQYFHFGHEGVAFDQRYVIDAYYLWNAALNYAKE